MIALNAILLEKLPPIYAATNKSETKKLENSRIYIFIYVYIYINWNKKKIEIGVERVCEREKERENVINTSIFILGITFGWFSLMQASFFSFIFIQAIYIHTEHTDSIYIAFLDCVWKSTLRACVSLCVCARSFTCVRSTKSAQCSTKIRKRQQRRAHTKIHNIRANWNKYYSDRPIAPKARFNHVSHMYTIHAHNSWDIHTTGLGLYIKPFHIRLEEKWLFFYFFFFFLFFICFFLLAFLLLLLLAYSRLYLCLQQHSTTKRWYDHITHNIQCTPICTIHTCIKIKQKFQIYKYKYIWRLYLRKYVRILPRDQQHTTPQQQQQKHTHTRTIYISN